MNDTLKHAEFFVVEAENRPLKVNLLRGCAIRTIILAKEEFVKVSGRGKEDPLRATLSSSCRAQARIELRARHQPSSRVGKVSIGQTLAPRIGRSSAVVTASCTDLGKRSNTASSVNRSHVFRGQFVVISVTASRIRLG